MEKILDTDLRVTDFRVTVLFVSLGITKFTSQGKRSHWNFFLEKHAQVPEKLTVTEKKLHWIYFPRISVPEFAVTNAKNTEFSYNRSSVYKSNRVSNHACSLFMNILDLASFSGVT